MCVCVWFFYCGFCREAAVGTFESLSGLCESKRASACRRDPRQRQAARISAPVSQASRGAADVSDMCLYLRGSLDIFTGFVCFCACVGLLVPLCSPIVYDTH